MNIKINPIDFYPVSDIPLKDPNYRKGCYYEESVLLFYEQTDSKSTYGPFVNLGNVQISEDGVVKFQLKNLPQIMNPEKIKIVGWGELPELSEIKKELEESA